VSIRAKRFHTKGGPNEAAQLLIDFEAQARKQDDEILAYFREKNCPLSPSQVWAGMGHCCPITSIRRGICSLTTAGLLEKTDIRVIGPYKRRECCWRLL
jgi:hypothetical protein